MIEYKVNDKEIKASIFIVLQIKFGKEIMM